MSKKKGQKYTKKGIKKKDRWRKAENLVEKEERKRKEIEEARRVIRENTWKLSKLGRGLDNGMASQGGNAIPQKNRGAKSDQLKKWPTISPQRCTKNQQENIPKKCPKMDMNTPKMDQKKRRRKVKNLVGKWKNKETEEETQRVLGKIQENWENWK